MELRPLVTKFVKFGVVGASGMLVHGGVLYLLKEQVGLNPFVANTIGFITAATTNYFLNRVWTFKSKERQVAVEYLKFILVSVPNTSPLSVSHLRNLNPLLVYA